MNTPFGGQTGLRFATAKARPGLKNWVNRGLAVVGCIFGSGMTLPLLLGAGPVLSEIHYHPVEVAAFQPDGRPVLDLTEDVHEFIEVHNPDAVAVRLEGWSLSSGIAFEFPAGTVLAPGGYLVVAKEPRRLEAVPAYGLPAGSVLGPWRGGLSNRRATVRLRDPQDRSVDAVAYSAEFPWPISADGLGVAQDWSGLDPSLLQYRGRSLERVSMTHTSADPANWVASPYPGEPSPGRANAARRAVPKPVVTLFQVYQERDETAVIRAGQAVRVDVEFSGGDALGDVAAEYFVDDINRTNEPVTLLPMSLVAAGAAPRYSAVLPGQADRSIVRFRVRANRGDGGEVVSPRSDDPFSWHAYFVSPPRVSANPIYELFVSTRSMSVLEANISQSPRRVTSSGSSGQPRASWNATEPGVFVVDGVVRDVRVRHHGSRYNRRAERRSLKVFFPRYHRYDSFDAVFLTDKGFDFVAGHGLFRAAGLPTSLTRSIDLYLNDEAVRGRLEEEEYDNAMLERYHREQAALRPGEPVEASGEFYKNVGTIDENGEGPYGRGDGRLYRTKGPWSPLQQYEWTYALQNHGWKGHTACQEMIEEMWRARGDRLGALNPNVPALRQYFEKYWDIDKMLTYLSVLNWMGPWDDTTQNHFVWQQSNGKWCMLPWDFDGMFGNGDNTPPSASIFIGEVGDPNNNFRGPNYIKDSFIKAFRDEFRQRIHLLAHTLLHPDQVTALGYGRYRDFAAARLATVITKTGLGNFERPDQPVAIGPVSGQGVYPGASLQLQPYRHAAATASRHASTTWEIRARRGVSEPPLYRLVSSNALTALAIPFGVLTFGRTYYWQAVFTDEAGHPSPPSAEASFVFGPTAGVGVVELIPLDATWKFHASGARPAPNWNGPGYADAAWATGRAVLGVETAPLPAPLRTPLPLSDGAGQRIITYYLRTTFQFTGPLSGAELRLLTVLDDGAVFYLNGREVLRLGMSPGAVEHATLANRTVSDAVEEGPHALSIDGLVVGTNVLAVEVHQVASASSDVVFGARLEASVAVPAATSVVLNEILAANGRAVAHNGGYPDWVELRNPTDQPQNLSGFMLSDDVLRPDRFVFPANTILAPRGTLIVWCDDDATAPGLHAGFALDRAGQTLVLLAPGANGPTPQDALVFGPQVPGLSIGRAADQSWQLFRPSPNAENEGLVALGEVDRLRINEWMAAPATGSDWLELHNPTDRPVALSGLFLTDTLDDPRQTQLPALSFVPARGFVQYFASGDSDAAANHLGFRLSADGDSIRLNSSSGAVIDAVTFGPQAIGVAQGRLPDGAETIERLAWSTPNGSNYRPSERVRVNEILASALPPLENAIEVFNPSTAPVSLDGWALSDDDTDLGRVRLPAGLEVPARGYAVLTATAFGGRGDGSGRVDLDAVRGGALYLSATDATGRFTGERAQAQYPATRAHESVGWTETVAQPIYAPMTQVTFGQENAPPAIGPLVVSEILFHPRVTDPNDPASEEYVKLVNIGSTELALGHRPPAALGWRVRGGIRWDFPPGARLSPGGCVVLVSFDPAQSSARRDAFRSFYRIPESVAVVGPFEGRLDNSDDVIELSEVVALASEAGADSAQTSERLREIVWYRDAAPWPVGASGSGRVLRRTPVYRLGVDPASWLVDEPHLRECSAGVEADWALVGVSLELGGANGPRVLLRFTAPPGAAVVIEARDRLDAGSWQTVAESGPALGGGAMREWAEVQGAIAAQRYYRLRRR